MPTVGFTSARPTIRSRHSTDRAEKIAGPHTIPSESRNVTFGFALVYFRVLYHRGDFEA